MNRNKKESVCFILNGNLPVPALKGGAIEQLVEILINENEKKNLFIFTVIGPYFTDVEKVQTKYNNSVFVNIKYSRKWNQYLGTGRAIIKKIIKKDFALLSTYNFQVHQYLLKHGGEFDYIVNEHADNGLFSLSSKKWGREKFVNHLHMETFADKVTLNSFHKYLCVSKYVDEVYNRTNVNKTPIKSTVLYNSVELNKFNRAISANEINLIREELGFTETDFIIIFCGRLKEFKGVKQLLQAVIALKGKVKLLILGQSETSEKISAYESEIRNLASQYDNLIRFSGYVANNEIWKYYQLSNIGVIPSICEESFNMVLLEMMATGLPTIATISGGMTEVGTNATTLYIEKGEKLVENIKDSIMELYNNPNRLKQMSESGRERAMLFDSTQYLENLSKSLHLLES